MQSLLVNLQKGNICLGIQTYNGNIPSINGAVVKYDLSGGSVFNDMKVCGNKTVF